MFKEKLVHTFFGSPVRTIGTTLFLLIYVSAAMWFLIAREIERYESRIEETTKEIKYLQSQLATQRRHGLGATVIFEEFPVHDAERSPDETQALRLVQFGKAAIAQADYVYARSLLSEANSVAETTDANYYLGVLAYMTGRYREAIGSWRPLVDQVDHKTARDLKIYILLAAYTAGDESTMEEILGGLDSGQ